MKQFFLYMFSFAWKQQKKNVIAEKIDPSGKEGENWIAKGS